MMQDISELVACHTPTNTPVAATSSINSQPHIHQLSSRFTHRPAFSFPVPLYIRFRHILPPIVGRDDRNTWYSKYIL
jgi:hypothetical protein